MLNILVIGAGTMGRMHAGSFAKMKCVSLVGIVDTDLNKAAKLADQLDTKAFRTYEEAVQQSLVIDAVSICVPTPVHKEFLLKAADDKKHIICEKPLARTLTDAKEMIMYCSERDVKLFVGHVVRFSPEYIKAKLAVEKGVVGKPAVVRTSRGGKFPVASNDWYTAYDSSGGLVLDLLIHDFDFLRWCFGEVERVYAKSSRGRVYERLEYALVTLRYKSGVIAHVEGSWAHQKFTTKFEIAGTEGIIDYDSSKVVSVLTGQNQSNSGGGAAVPESPLEESSYYRELEHFVHCIKTNDDPVISAADAYKAMEISMAVLESIETGKAVTLNNNVKELI
ncbi:Gfo/Idh/MocA family oxidoreductase [Cerasibacillus terrae]|uniref:Gfo/Idh/MocA family oxidoreductase n=1 Tax=Cerasibacillus terrae TaxID=2498845 RepID=A0A5C8NJ25_9BACI|nr:Gfo/Idh/MocA family oxidoreductase [Cerasibacillus terrae]TXL61086.1 Gfo/Idh/MocA family oxidoreductase [Cerasibacillus terrae]